MVKKPEPNIHNTGAGAVTSGGDIVDSEIHTHVDQSTHHHYHSTASTPDPSLRPLDLASKKLFPSAVSGRGLERVLEPLGAFGDSLLKLLGRSPSIMGHVVSGSDQEIDAHFARVSESWGAALLKNLVNVDISLQWEPGRYVELEVEVEEHDVSGRTRAILAIDKALQRHRHRRVILILGDPGSGKSVSLRQLARSLLAPEEILRAGRLPYYLNLRDWPTPPKWVEGAGLQADEVATHLLDWAARQFAEDINEKHDAIVPIFARLLDSGRIFLLLDSFDEIPAALDAHERGRLLGIISAGVHQVLHGGPLSQRRGVLASRIYRRPIRSYGDPRQAGNSLKTGFDADCQLTVRPLTDAILLQFFAKCIQGHSDIGERLLRDRPALAASSRNPFTAMLVVGYLKARFEQGDDTLPETRRDCYHEALRARLVEVRDEARAFGIPVTDHELWDGLKKLALAIFHNKGSFDIAWTRVADVWPLLVQHSTLTKILCDKTVLRRGRLGTNIGFSHRRLAEYLAALSLPNKLDDLPLTHILSANGRWRDALVVWCETAPPGPATELANWCWAVIEVVKGKHVNLRLQGIKVGEEISSMESSTQTDEENILRINNMAILRFLIEGYRGRLESLTGIQTELFKHISSGLNYRTDILTSKRLGEAACLLPCHKLPDILDRVLRRGSRWVTMETLRNCRFQEFAKSSVADNLAEFVHAIPLRELLKPDGIMLSLRLSPGLEWLRREIQFRIADSALFILAHVLGIILFKDGALVFIGMFWIGGALVTHLLGMSRKTRAEIIKIFRWVYALLILYGAVLNLIVDGHFGWGYTSVGLLLLPILPLCASRSRNIFISTIRSSTQNGNALFVIGFIFVIVFFWLVRRFYNWGTFTPFFEGAKMVLLAVVGGKYLLVYASNVIVASRTHLAFRRIPMQMDGNLTRVELANWLSILGLRRYSLKLLDRIEQQGILPKGAWPSGRMPILPDSEVNDRLGQLEEQWELEEERLKQDKEIASLQSIKIRPFEC